MSPPQLTPNRPISLFSQPIQITICIPSREDFHIATGNCIHGGLSKLLHPNKPLVGQVRLDGSLAPIAVLDIDLTVFGLFQKAKVIHGRNDFGSGFRHAQADIGTSVFIDGSIGVHDVEHR